MIRPPEPKPPEPQPGTRAIARSIKTLLIGVGLPAKPFIYVGF